MAKKQKTAISPIIKGVDTSPQSTKSTNPILDGISALHSPTIPSVDTENRSIDLTKYKPYLGDSFVFTDASDRHRALNQPSGQQFGNAVLRLLPNTALEFVSMAANTIDLEDYFNSDNEMGNALSKWAQEQKKSVDESLPIYRRDPNKALDVGDAAWWFENGTNLVQSAAAFVGLGYLTGGAAMGTLTKGSKALKWLNGISEVNPQALKGAASLTSSVMLNQAEGVGIAVNVYDTAFNKKLGELQADESMVENNSPKQLEAIAKSHAAEKASNALNFNRLNILLNLSSANLFIKTPALTRQTITQPSLRKSFKRVGLEGLQEATEEEINLISENRALADSYDISDAARDVFSREGAESALLGFIGGAAQTGLTMSGRLLPTQKVGGNRISENEIQRQRFFDQQQAKARWDELSKGEKLQSNTDAYLSLQEQSNLIKEINSANKNKDYEQARELSDRLLIMQAGDAFNTGTTEQLLDTYKAFGNMSEEEATEKGIYNNEDISDPNHYKNKSKKAVNTILKLEDAWNSSRDYINQTPVYESDGSLKWNGIYTNRAESIDLENKVEELSRLKDNTKEGIEEILEKMNVENDSYSFSTTGELNVIDINKKEYKTNLEELTVPELKDLAKLKNIPKAYAMNKGALVDALVESNEKSKDTIKALKNSNTYKAYQSFLNEESRLKSRQQELANEYVELTSNNTQKDIERYYESAKNERRKLKENQKKEQAKVDNNKKKQEKKAKFSNEVREEEATLKTNEEKKQEAKPTVEETTEEVIPTGKFKFNSDVSAELDEHVNNLVNNDEYTPDQRIHTLKDNLQNVLDNSEGLTPEQIKNIKLEANRALKYLRDLKANDNVIVENSIEKQAEEVLNQLADAIESDLSPSLKEETSGQKRRRKANLMLSLIDAAEQLDIIDFRSLALWANTKLGSEKFSKIFVPFQDLYNGVSGKDRAEYDYVDIFSSNKDKKDFLKNDEEVISNTLPFGVYTVDHDMLDEIHEDSIRNLAKLNSLDIDDKKVDYGNIDDGVYKVVFGHNKVAYLAKNYIKTIEIDDNGVVKVRKSDADNNINNISEDLLDYSKLKTGDKIRLVPLESITLEDGSIVNKDGTIQHIDGRVEERNPQEVAPIGIIYNNQLLSSAYLHIADWINEENVVGDVELDREQLVAIRREVLNSGENGIETTITSVSPGWLMESKDGIASSTAENLPDVTEFAIRKNGKFHTGYETTINTINDIGQDGTVNAIVPISDTEKMAIALNRNKVSKEYANSIVKAVDLHFNGSANDPVIKSLADDYGINLLTMEGLRDYVGRFVYSYNTFEGNTDSFKDYLAQQKSNVYMLRITGNSIEFGRGAGIKFNAISKDSPERHMSTFLNNLGRHLEGMYMNMEVERLGENDFVLPVIEGQSVKGNKQSYSDYIKNHTNTKYFSVKTESGKPIYTIQRTFEFDTKGIIGLSSLTENLKQKVVGDNNTITQEEYNFAIPFITGNSKIIELDSNNMETQKSKDNTIKLINIGNKLANILNLKSREVKVESGQGFGIQTIEQWLDKEGIPLGDGISVLKKYLNNYNKYSKQSTLTRTLSTPTGKKVTISANDTPPSDLSPKLIEESEFTNILSQIPSDIYIEGMGYVLQNSVIDAITADVLSSIVIDKEKKNESELLNEYIKYFKEVRTFYDEAGNTAMAELAQQIVDNGSNIIKIVSANLAKMNTVDVSLVEIDDEAGNNDTDSKPERNRFDSEAIFKENPVSSLTNDIKKYLSAVYDVETDSDGKASLDEDGNVINKKSIFGLDVVVPFDIVINDLYSILANTNEEYVPPVFETMMDEIKKHTTLKPYLENVLLLMEEAPQDIKAKFVTAMSKHYTHHKYLFRIYDKQSNTYKLIPLDSDGFSNQNKVIQDWNNRLKRSKYIENTSETLEELVVVNKDEIDNRFKEIVDNFKEGKSIIIDLRNWLNDVGIKVPDIVLVRLNNMGYYVDGQKVTMEYMLNSPTGVFNLINKNLTERGDESIVTKNPFQDKAIKALAKEVSKSLNNIYSNSFSDVRGETYFGYSPNKYFISRFQDLSHDLDLVSKLSKASFSRNSSWLKELTNRDKDGNVISLKTDGVFYRNFKYFTTDGIKDQKGNDGKKLEDMSPADHELYKLGLFFNQGGNIRGQKSRRIMEMLYPTISDKSLTLGMRQVGYHVSTMPDGKIFNGNPIWNILYDNLIQSEINRITEFQNNKSKYNIKGYDKGAELFYFVPELNELQEIWNEGNLKPIIKGSPEHKAIERTLKNHVYSLIEQKKDVWNTYGFVDTKNNTLNVVDGRYNKSFGNNVDSVANNYVINYLLFNANVFQTFVGDPALFYKGTPSDTKLKQVQDTFVNVGVRLAAHIAPGLDIPAEKGTTYNSVFLVDREGDISVNKEYLKTILDEDEYNQYLDVAGTDAQEFTTLSEHLDIMERQGRINATNKATLLDREEKGLPLDIRQLTGGKETLQPMKLVYMNKVWDNGIEKIVYVKSSSFPLIKQLTKGLEIDKLRVAMEKGKSKADRVAFGTSVKLGNVNNPVNIFNKDGSIKNNLEFKQSDLQPLPRWGHRRQLEVPFDEKKYKINDGTQQSKLLFTNLLDLNNFEYQGEKISGKELRDKFNDTYGKLFKLKYKALMQELTIDDNKLDLKKVQKILTKEGLERNFPINDLQAISLIEKQDGKVEFLSPLWATASSSKFEALLSSIVDNRIRKRMMPGKSYVLGTEEGFQQDIREVSTVQEALEQQPNIIFDETWLKESGGKLRPMRVEGNKVLPDEVILPMKFYNNDGTLIDIKQFVNSNGYLDTERIDPQLLEQFGFRIPTQGHNSMTYIKVVGFLPYESGDLIITPRDFTRRMGSDFDVDKLYTMAYNTNYNQKDGIISRVKEGQETWSEEKSLQDSLLDIHFSVLRNTSKKVQKQIHAPLGFGLLEGLANDIDNAFEDTKYSWSALSEDYQKTRYLSARGAKIGVGAFSLDNTFNSLLQGREEINLMTKKEVIINGKTYLEDVLYEVKLGDRKSNKLSDNKVNTVGKDRFKSDVISAYQSASVDNEKVQLLNRLNINKHTFAAVKLLNQLGFEEDVVMYFINQPIIRDYVRLMSLAQDSTSSWDTKKVDAEINRLYPSEIVDGTQLNSLSENISLTDMGEMIYNVRPNNFNDKQQALFYKFKEVTQFGESLGQVQSTINSDSAGVGKNLFYSLIKEDQILELHNNSKVWNAHKLLGEYWSPDMIEGWQTLSQEDRNKIIKALKDEGYVLTRGQLYIKPTTINGYASIYGTVVNAKLWNKLFGFDSPVLLSALEQIVGYTGKDSDIISVKADAYNKAWNFMKSYLMSRAETLTEGDIIAERQRLLYDTKTNKSLATIIDDIKDKGLLKNNPFINRLETEIFKEVLPSRLTYNSSLAEGQDERYIYSGVIDLLSKNTVLGTYNGIEYNTKKLIQDLVTHQFITGGVQRANQFIKYIPVQYLNEIGYYDLIKGINLKSKDTFLRDADGVYGTTEQYIQHYPREFAQYGIEGIKMNNDESVFEIEDINKFKDSVIGHHSYIAIPSDTTKSRFKLYKRTEDNPNKYIQIDTLGDRDLRETNFGEKAVTTIVSNKSKYSEPKKEELPKDTKVQQKKETEDIAKVIPPESERGFDYEYGLREENVPGIKKIGNALNYIINKSNNKYYSWYADQLLNNLNKLNPNIGLNIDSALDAEGRTNYNKDYIATSIDINPLNIDTKEDFERVILHELTHAFVKKATKSNNSAVVRLEELHEQFSQQIRYKYTGEVVDRVWNEIKNNQRVTVPIKDARIIRAAMNFDEFITESMSNKEIQNVLDGYTPTKEYKTLWEKFKNLVADLLESFGFSKGDKALGYVVSNVISLIDDGNLPSDSTTGKKSRTVEWINNKFNLTLDDGTSLPKNNPEEIKQWIEDNVDNLDVKIVKNKYLIVTDKNINLKLTTKKNLPTSNETLNIFAGTKENVELSNFSTRPFKLGNLEFKTVEHAFQFNKTFRVEQTRYSTATQEYLEDVRQKILNASTAAEAKKIGKTIEGLNIERWNKEAYNVMKQAIKESFIQNPNKLQILLDTGNAILTHTQDNSRWKKDFPNILMEVREELRGYDNTGQLNMYDLSISRRAAQDENQELPVSKLLKTRRTRIAMLSRLINRADANNEFAKAEELKQQKQELEESIPIIARYTTLEDIEVVAKEDLDEVANMLDKNLSESDILYALKITNLWQKGIDVFFDEDTLTSEPLRNTFKGIEGTAESYSEILYNKLVKLTNDFVKTHTGLNGNIDVEQIMASMKDISKIESNVLNLSRNDNMLLSAIYNSVKKANYAAMNEAKEIVDELNSLIETISPVLNSMSERGKKYEVFRQKFSDGLYTGNLVGKFTPEFEQELKSLNDWLDNVKTADKFIQHAKKRKKTIITFDVRKLFPREHTRKKFTDKQIEDYKQELRDLLGDAAFNIYMNRQERMIERYSEDRQHNLERILSKYNLNNEDDLKSSKNKEAKKEFYTWLLQNSPYETATQLLEEKVIGIDGKYIPTLSTKKYLVEVPRKVDNNGRDLGFYDSNFQTIENNKDLLEFYNYITDVFDKLKIYLPQEVQDRIQFGGLPEISKAFLESAYDVKGGKEAMSMIWDKLRESVRTEDMSDVSYADIDPSTGKPDRFLSVDIMKNNKQFYFDYISRKTIEWEQNNPNKNVTSDLKARWGREAKDMLAQKKSYDLGKVVKAYSMLVLAYKHKSRIEDQLKAAETIIHRSKEMELSAKKRPLKNERGQIIYKDEDESFKNTKASLEYFMDVFYGQARKLEGITDTEVLTTEEQRTKEEILRLQEKNQTQFDNQEISEEVYNNTKKNLDEQLDKLGGVAVWSKRGDNVLKYIQLKVMGWNLFSGFSNVGFGWIANFIEAADGRVFNQQELLNGYKLTLHSIGKNLSFGKVQSDTATKIRSLMDKFDVLKDMSNELYNNSIPSEFTKSTKWLAPYNITQRTEYINQAPLMIALLNRMKTEDGKTLWEQFDKDGNWVGEGEIPTDIITKFRLKLDGIIEKTHGDYGSPLKLKEKLIGRGLSQFRTWMFEGFAQRFEPEKYDPNLEMVRKGRYISLYSNYFKKLGFFGGLADLAINLLRKLALQGTKFDNLTDGEIFNEVDAANMRKVLSEITIYMSLTTTALMLKMLSKGLDDEEKYMANYLINHSSRLRTDILFYFNPIEFRKLLRDPVPAATLIKDATEWVYAAGKLVAGKDIYETGIYSGESRLFRETMQLLPFGTQVYRNIAASKTQY